ncbi:MAG TPA: hypothetical protein VGO53_13280 [Steroidobacteraceae bacterium]|jgi:hypothetical protein|nr:hypothetical protein [Steroidobacteraceae bacterium]
MSEADRISTTVHATGELSLAQWNEIWTLTEEFYDVERSYAEAELRQRQTIATFRMNDSLLGMAAIDVYPVEFRGQKLAVISTTHVLIREAWRGRNLLQKLGARTFLATRLRYPLRPIYWFFDTFSYKSYLLLPRNFRHFWPRYDEPTPEPRAALMDQLATQTYGAAWQPTRGVVARSGQKRLRSTAAPLVLGPGTDPELEFFARANPGHPDGDMLVCLCPLTLSNWLSLARKALQRLRRFGMH